MKQINTFLPIHSILSVDYFFVRGRRNSPPQVSRNKLISRQHKPLSFITTVPTQFHLILINLQSNDVISSRLIIITFPIIFQKRNRSSHISVNLACQLETSCRRYKRNRFGQRQDGTNFHIKRKLVESRLYLIGFISIEVTTVLLLGNIVGSRLVFFYIQRCCH